MPKQLPYKDSSRPVSERVEDLLARMTLEEKIGQICQMRGRDNEWSLLKEKHVGSCLHVMGLPLADFQRAIGDESRLGIPVLFAEDCIHGHALCQGATVFPTQLALSCSWNPQLLETVARVTAVEMTATGVHWTFSPVLCIARDLRWGRVSETFGEDPYLLGVLGAAMVRGYQGDDLSAPDSVLACAKHYAGYSQTEGGRDATEMPLSERQLRQFFLPPFHEAVKAGCATFMAGYHAIDGVPCSINHWLLTEVLRDEWGFEGFVISDWDNLGHVINRQYVCADGEEAAVKALQAGNDIVMNTPSFPDDAAKAVREGALAESTIDECCRRMLRLKFKLGLFDHKRHGDLDKAEEILGCQAHMAEALTAAEQSIVLLKNENDLLPLGGDVRKIAVIGPNADDLTAQLGDWSLRCRDPIDDPTGWPQHPSDKQISVLEGIRALAGDDRQVSYCKGCDALGLEADEIDSAAAVAADADVAVVVVGDRIELCGEHKDRVSLDLTGRQQALLEAVHATGTPMVVVLIASKPLSIPWVADSAAAILAAWNPGSMGGQAVAEILFGQVNPCAKLSISFPYHVGQQPVYYNQFPGWHGDKYVDLPEGATGPLFAFGFGLSYTSYAYSNCRVHSSRLKGGEDLEVSVDVENIGKRAGTEIVQLYINDLVASVTRPVKQLRAFARIDLQPGEKKTVTLTVPYDRLAVLTPQMQWVVEPGEFEVMVGPGSRDEDLLKEKFEVVE